mmetsp:Transcript_2861/g.3353  ORF Transcript_2861/g.3353 Transcript_2861/m.3353 type:complete len:80 (-) Transcript_2861:140-379(-)
MKMQRRKSSPHSIHSPRHSLSGQNSSSSSSSTTKVHGNNNSALDKVPVEIPIIDGPNSERNSISTEPSAPKGNEEMVRL